LSKKVGDKLTKYLAEPAELHFRKENLQKIRESGHRKNEFQERYEWMLKCCKIARIHFSKQEAILEVLEVDWRKRNEIDFMVGEPVGAAVR